MESLYMEYIFDRVAHGEVAIVKGFYRNKRGHILAKKNKFYVVHINGIEGWPIVRQDYCIKLPK